MNQQMMLQRILDILNQKILMGAGNYAGKKKKMIKHKRAGVYAGVYAGEDMGCGRKRKAIKHKRRAGVYAGEDDESVFAGRKKKAKKMVKKDKKVTSPWIKHVKKYAKEHNITYGEAMKKARASYKKLNK